MKLAAKILAVLSVLALASPALACSCDEKENTKSAEAKAAPQKMAKAEKKRASTAKGSPNVKPPSASN